MACQSTTGCADDCETCKYNDATIESRYDKVLQMLKHLIESVKRYEDIVDEGDLLDDGESEASAYAFLVLQADDCEKRLKEMGEL